ncbi:MAG: hypothetical protein OXG88_11880 [Gammaproteobacteria bacterium]|nr:hypothetical protein [Gammaproteobacteria bacterium]
MADRPIVVTDPDLSRQPQNERGSRPPRNRGGGSNVGILFLTVFVILGLGTGGWFLYSMYTYISEQNSLLREQITALEDRLNINVETGLETETSVKEQLEFWEDEIRKLWDLSNKRNRPAIEALESTIATLQGRDDILGEDIKTLKTYTEDNAATILQNSRSLRDLVDTVNSTNQLAITSSDQLEVRVKKNEEAIEAIDTWRIQNNNWIRDLQRRTSDLERE